MILMLFILMVPSFTEAQSHIPKVFALDAQVLQSNKEYLAYADSNVKQAYTQLLKNADRALTRGPHSVMEKKHEPPGGDKHDYMSLAPYFWPDTSKSDGLPYIRKDGQTNPEVKEYLDNEYMLDMVGDVYSLAQAFYFSNNEQYARHASLLLKTWFLNPLTRMNPNVTYSQAIKGVNDGRGSGIIDSRHFIKVIDAIGFIQESEHWKKEDQEGMKKWFNDFLHWMQTSKNGLHEMNNKNNHGTWYDAQRLSYALFADSVSLAKRIIANAQTRLDQQMDEAGMFPKELERTMSLHYSSFNLEAFFLIAQMADTVGIDLWHYTSAKGRSIKKGFEMLKPYLTNQQKWEGQQIKDYDFKKEAYHLLMTASRKLDCKDCEEAIHKHAGRRLDELPVCLLYCDLARK